MKLSYKQRLLCDSHKSLLKVEQSQVWNYRDIEGISSYAVINNLRRLLIDIIQCVYNSLYPRIVAHNYFDTIGIVKSFGKIY